MSASSTTPSNNASATTPASRSGSLNKQATIGIGVGVPVGVVALAVLLAALLWRKRQQRKRRNQVYTHAARAEIYEKDAFPKHNVELDGTQMAELGATNAQR